MRAEKEIFFRWLKSAVIEAGNKAGKEEGQAYLRGWCDGGAAMLMRVAEKVLVSHGMYDDYAKDLVDRWFNSGVQSDEETSTD